MCRRRPLRRPSTQTCGDGDEDGNGNASVGINCKSSRDRCECDRDVRPRPCCLFNHAHVCMSPPSTPNPHHSPGSHSPSLHLRFTSNDHVDVGASVGTPAFWRRRCRSRGTRARSRSPSERYFCFCSRNSRASHGIGMLLILLSHLLLCAAAFQKSPGPSLTAVAAAAPPPEHSLNLRFAASDGHFPFPGRSSLTVRRSSFAALEGEAGTSAGSEKLWKITEDECECLNSTSDGGEVECTCRGREMTSLRPDLRPDVHRITIADSPNFLRLDASQLGTYRRSLREIALSELPSIREIGDSTFADMDNLTTIYIHDTPSLQRLSPNVFKGHLPKLKLIKIHHSSLNQVPNLSELELSPNQLLTLDLENNKIKVMYPGWINKLKIEYLALSYNQLEEIGPNSFEGAEIAKLTLKGNHHLKTLHQNAFVGIDSLRHLDLSETAITQLPTLGLEHIETLRLEHVYTLTVIPSIYKFEDLQEAWMTFAYHCCAFAFPETHDPLEFGKYKERIAKMAEANCQAENHQLAPENQMSHAATAAATRRKRESTLQGSGVVEESISADSAAQIPLGHDVHVDDSGFGTFHDSGEPSIIKHCNFTVRRPPVVHCKPLPDAFSPCEDIMGNLWLRAGVWIVVTLALVGNTAVLVVLIFAPSRMTVQRFLMANLSCADLCMGLYLLMVASEDLVSLGTYFNYAIEWQQGWGCQIAGFFTVFASELSVFTLAVITGERWYALTRAMHLTKRLTLTGAAELMTAGWMLSILLAVLPLVGVSSYSKTSICLPMEASTIESQGYLMFLLLFNGSSFFLVALAYWQMYRAVAFHGSAATSAHIADAAVAKKMALLVFTDFACWAPVAFFGLTAVAGHPLIGITDSKILLVFFYPLNACCNPYLYAILTKQYRRDLLLLLSSFGGGGASPNHGGPDTLLHTVRRHGSSHAGDHHHHPQIKETTEVIVTIPNSHGPRRNHDDDGAVAETTFSFVQHSGDSAGRNGRTNNQYQYVGVPSRDECTRNSTRRESADC